MNKLAAIIITLLILLAPAQQPSSGCAVAGPDLAVSLASAGACLDIPAGTYTAPALTGGAWLNITAPGFVLRAEPGTVIQTSGVTLTTDLYLVNIQAPGVRVEGLHIQIGGGFAGSREVGAIRADSAADHATITGNEISGGYSGNGSNGFAIGTYRLYTTSNAVQNVTIAENYIHDTPTTGIGVNSSSNIIRGNRLERIGVNSLQHAFYAQGGNNLYDGNIVDGVSGYAYHGWKKVPNLDGSGDIVTGNTFRGYGTGAALVAGMPNASNPTLPIGANLTRYATIANNVFVGAGVVSVSVPATVASNVFEGARLELAPGSDGSDAVGNRFSSLTQQSATAIAANAPAFISGNTIDMNGYTGGIGVAGNGSQIQGNRITRTAAGTGDWMSAIVANANDLDISGNYININGAQLITPGSAPSGLRLHDNVLITTRFVMRDSARVMSGVVYDNRWVGQFNSGAGLTFRDNDGVVT